MKLDVVRKSVVREHSFGVCVWNIDGKYLSDEDGRYLSMDGIVGDKEVERKMRDAAYYWMGEKIGEPEWRPGVRQISDEEWHIQRERLAAGQTPDPVTDALRGL